MNSTNISISNVSLEQNATAIEHYNKAHISSIAYHIIINIESLCGLCGNLLLLLVIFKYKKLQSSSTLIIGSVAVADFINCLSHPVATVLAVIKTLNLSSSWKVICYIKLYLSGYGGYGNLLGLSILSVDRVVAVKFPLFYRNNVTNRCTAKILVISWIFLQIYLIAFEVNYKIRFTQVCLITKQDLMNYGFLYPALILMIAQILVSFYVLYNFRKHIKNTHPDVQLSSPEESQRKHIQKERKVVKIYGQMLVVYFLSYIPTIIFGRIKSSHPLRLVANCFFLISSFANPVMIFQASNFKKALYDLLKIKQEVITNPRNIETSTTSGRLPETGTRLGVIGQPSRTSNTNIGIPDSQI